jgi:TRAP-type C4-dicarboxylate transport system permease small subunit
MEEVGVSGELVFRWLDRVERFITALTAVIMIVLSALICWQVFSRYILNSSPFWIEEISVISLMWVGLLGAAGCVWTESHMSLELVVSKLPGTFRVWLKALTDLAIAGFALLLCDQGYFLVQRTMGGTLATMPLAVGYTYLVLPLAGGLMALFALVRAVGGVARHYAAGQGGPGHD